MNWLKYILPLFLLACLLFKGCEKEAADQYITDIDDNKYKIIQIGSQTWMAENLRVTRDTEGDNYLQSYCYMDRIGKCEEFGRLYPWEYALQASPAGWRLPTSDDWEKLEIELGMDPELAETFGWRGTDQGAQLKEGGSSGFDALLSGYKDGLVLWDGRYFDIGYFGAFWSATEYDSVKSVAYFLYVTNDNVYKGSYDKTAALSVRCVRDD
jgi:uncharacterized protein (TIGR02145 family)